VNRQRALPWRIPPALVSHLFSLSCASVQQEVYYLYTGKSKLPDNYCR